MAINSHLSDSQYVKDQYHRPANLDARIRLHLQCSTNRYGWQRWLFDQIPLSAPCRLLELGCGTANLWLENLDRLPSDGLLIFSDLSNGMVKTSRQNLGDHLPGSQFLTIDAQNIPFPEYTFDLVIANHMLYHVPKRPTALSEFRRILKPGGILYASTIGENHLLELNELLSRFGHGLESEYRSSSSGFLLENGIQQLKPFFERISVSRYPDSLIVTDAALLTDYILSGRNTVDSGLKEDLLQFIAHEITVDGHIHITKDSGLFIASR